MFLSHVAPRNISAYVPQGIDEHNRFLKNKKMSKPRSRPMRPRSRPYNLSPPLLDPYPLPSMSAIDAFVGLPLSSTSWSMPPPRQMHVPVEHQAQVLEKHQRWCLSDGPEHCSVWIEEAQMASSTIVQLAHLIHACILHVLNSFVPTWKYGSGNGAARSRTMSYTTRYILGFSGFSCPMHGFDASAGFPASA
jgi:hypothetical protein